MDKIYHGNQRCRMHTISMSVERAIVLSFSVIADEKQPQTLLLPQLHFALATIFLELNAEFFLLQTFFV